MKTRFLTHLHVSFSPLSASRTHRIPRLLLARLPASPIGANGAPLAIKTEILPQGSRKPARCVVGLKGGEEVVFTEVLRSKQEEEKGSQQTTTDGQSLDLGKLKMRDVLEELERRFRIIARKDSIAA